MERLEELGTVVQGTKGASDARGKACMDARSGVGVRGPGVALAQSFSNFFSKFAVGPRKVEISKKFAGRDRKSAFHSRLKRHGAFILP